MLFVLESKKENCLYLRKKRLGCGVYLPEVSGPENGERRKRKLMKMKGKMQRRDDSTPCFACAFRIFSN